MNIDEIINELADNDRRTNDSRDKVDHWKTNVARMESELSECQRTLRSWEDNISNLQRKRIEFLAQLKAMLCGEPQEAPGKQSDEKLQPDDTPQMDDDIYSIVRRPVRIDEVRWAKDVERVLEVTVTDNETHQAIKLFTENEPCIKACIYGIGESVDIKYDENSGELLGVAVLEA